MTWLMQGDCLERMAEISDGSVDLTVTSPPFLDVVQYAADNWLRCWFNGLDADALGTASGAGRRDPGDPSRNRDLGRVVHQ